MLVINKKVSGKKIAFLPNPPVFRTLCCVDFEKALQSALTVIIWEGPVRVVMTTDQGKNDSARPGCFAFNIR